jgi:hypothetical protein
MGDTSQPRVTNYDLALMIGKIQGQIETIFQTSEKLDHSINGNGKPGILADHRELVTKVDKIETKLCGHLDDHASEKKAASEKKEKISARTWAVVMVVIGAFITQLAALIVLFIRTGFFK